MKRISLSVFLTTILSVVIISSSADPTTYQYFAPNTVTIQRTVDFRTGPGSFHQLHGRLESGTKARRLDQQQQWIKVRVDSKEGWVPEKAIKSPGMEKKDKTEISSDKKMDKKVEEAFDQLSGEKEKDERNATASRAQIAGAVKGFAKKFARSKTGSGSLELEPSLRTGVGSSDYRRFRRQRFRDWSWQQAQQRYAINADTVDPLSVDLDAMGWGIANVIAKKGLIQNQPLQEYLTKIALTVVESSHRYETPVHIYILDSPEITGYACPNGAIFVTRGSLQAIQTEAQFAFYIAHEWAHVALNHGKKETQERSEKIKAQNAFNEMDQALGDDDRTDKYDRVEEELNEMASQLYDYVVSGRLNNYEYEADKWGLIYTYRAGYNPYASLRLLREIREQTGDKTQKTGKLKWTGTPVDSRIQKVDQLLTQLNINPQFGLEYRHEFNQKTSTIK